MKEEFKKWLISLNCEGINSLGVNEIVSRVDEELRIVRANEQERMGGVGGLVFKKKKKKPRQ